MAAKNILLFLSDQHTRGALGCYGHPMVQTPNLDALARRGVRFTNAYTNSPVCAPARASLATGQYVSKIRCWDQAHPYRGQHRSWGHNLMEAGHRVAAIGKLHFRSTEDPNGFHEEIHTMHLLNGVGDLIGLVRPAPKPRGNNRLFAEKAGPGPSTYSDYDQQISEKACTWLKERAADRPKPWALFASFVFPHFPLRVAQRFFDLYPLKDMPVPRLYRDRSDDHPSLNAIRAFWDYDEYFDEEKLRIAQAAYYGMVTCLDENIGRVIKALNDLGMAEDTTILYSTDHGEMLGTRGYWGKSVMYEESAGVPMIIAGPGFKPGTVVDAPVSHVDLYPTIVECAGSSLSADERKLPGVSLRGYDKLPADRPIISEYHAAGSSSGMTMLRLGRWKYVYYVGYPPQLFDLYADPLETRDLGTDPSFAAVRRECDGRLRSIIDPEAADRNAFEDQRATIERNGGAAACLAQGDMHYSPIPGERAMA